MTASTSWIIGSFAWLAAVACSAQEPPAEFPELDRSITRPVLVVGSQSEKTTYLPEVAVCRRPNFVCTNPPPFYFKITVDSVIYGQPVPKEFYVATYSPHMGKGEFYNSYPGPKLILLHTDGRQFVMPFQGTRELTADRHGQLHVVQHHRPYPAHILPCGIATMREEIRYEDFPTVQEYLFADMEPEYAQQRRDYLRYSAVGARPRYAISLARVRAYLSMTKPGIDEMQCPAPKARKEV